MYVTDALRIIGENIAKFGGGSYVKIRWIDLIHPKPEETRTANEIIEHMKKKLGEVK